MNGHPVREIVHAAAAVHDGSALRVECAARGLFEALKSTVSGSLRLTATLQQ
jgi:hypothetical protein